MFIIQEFISDYLSNPDRYLQLSDELEESCEEK
jgi:hypothetical protein